jgi:energy-coupling factor transport system substrate-specific component
VTSIRSGFHHDRPHHDRPGLPRLTRAQLTALAAGALAGLVVWLVGLPHDPVWDTTWSALTVPAALVVGAGVGVVTIAATTRRRWRVVDMTVAAVLAVAGGLLLWGMNTAWTPLTTPIGRLYPPLPALLNGIWLLPGVLGGIVVRRPGAALFAETVAAVIEAQLGGLWGFASVYYGVIEGLGAELVLALLLYRRFGPVAALAAGAGSGIALSVLDLTFYFTDYPAGQKVAYVVLSVLSGAVVAGGGAWAITRALARTGALAPLESGRAAERV